LPLDLAPAVRIRATSRLSAIKVAKLRDPGLYEDGGGLRLVITDKGVKRWTLRITINGRRVERGLGVWPEVSLEDARRKALDMRAAAKEGRDLKSEMHLGSRLKGVTFETAFNTFFEIRRQKLSNGKHVAQWETTMTTYVFPTIGRRPVADVTAAEVIAILKPIWFTKPETASRVLQRVRAVFDSAILRGTRERANPCVGVVNELGTGHRKVQHHPALPWRQVPAFVRFLRQHSCNPTTALALEFLILTASRSGEIRGAVWTEVNLELKTWTIPGHDPATGRRMKGGETHVVPLSSRALAILQLASRHNEGQLIFPGNKAQPLSDSTLSKLMRDAKIAGTPHGFRSAFKDWAAEAGVRDEVSEAALAHADSNEVRAAYRRTRYLEERTGVMQSWADFVCNSCVNKSPTPLQRS
jgi:integrase